MRWPTLVLAAAALVGQVATIAAAWDGTIGLFPTVILASICAYVGFTPVHEAAHRHLGRLDALVGHLCVIPLLGAFGAYRFLHGQHHAHADDPARDPDHWTTGAASPLRWATADLGYLTFYARHWGSRPIGERAELVVRGAFYVGIPLAALGDPALFAALVCGWLLPARIVLTVLAWSFAWLPHGLLVHGPVGVWRHPVVTVLLLGQNHHLAHHADPRRPFWAFTGAWAPTHEAPASA